MQSTGDGSGGGGEAVAGDMRLDGEIWRGGARGKDLQSPCFPSDLKVPRECLLELGGWDNWMNWGKEVGAEDLCGGRELLSIFLKSNSLTHYL